MSEPRYLRATVPRVVAKAHVTAIMESGLDPFQYFLNNDLLTWSNSTEAEWLAEGGNVTVFESDENK